MFLIRYSEDPAVDASLSEGHFLSSGVVLIGLRDRSCRGLSIFSAVDRKVFGCLEIAEVELFP